MYFEEHSMQQLAYINVMKDKKAKELFHLQGD